MERSETIMERSETIMERNETIMGPFLTGATKPVVHREIKKSKQKVFRLAIYERNQKIVPTILSREVCCQLETLVYSTFPFCEPLNNFERR